MPVPKIRSGVERSQGECVEGGWREIQQVKFSMGRERSHGPCAGEVWKSQFPCVLGEEGGDISVARLFEGIDTPGSYFRWRENFVPMFNGVERLQGLPLGVDFQWKDLPMPICLGEMLEKTTQGSSGPLWIGGGYSWVQV